MDVFLTILDVFLPVSGCKNASVECTIGSNSLYDCIIGRGLYTLKNIHPDVFLPVVKMPCTHIMILNCIIYFVCKAALAPCSLVAVICY